jgi:hypothetical protein
MEKRRFQVAVSGLDERCDLHILVFPVKLNGLTTLVRPAPATSRFKDVNILGAGFCATYNVRVIEGYKSGEAKLAFQDHQCHDLGHIRYSTSESHKLRDSFRLLALMGEWQSGTLQPIGLMTIIPCPMPSREFE